MKVLIIADHASTRFGGEAILPVHHFRQLRARGIEAWLIANARTREELLALFPEDTDRIHFTRNTVLHRALWAAGKHLHPRLRVFSAGTAMRMLSQLDARRIARRLVAEHDIDVVHIPAPVSPKEIHITWNLDRPLVIGPLNGGMDLPPAFVHLENPLLRQFIRLGRAVAPVLNRLWRGKWQADLVLVANRRTKEALPPGLGGEVRTLPENGVELEVWAADDPGPSFSDVVEFIYVGRLVEIKGVDLLVEAFSMVRRTVPTRLTIVGDGTERARLEAQVDALGLSGIVEFAGWCTQQECARRLRQAQVFVLPSLQECGGAVVLEAMACALPVIATDWGGPADYLDPSCGILIPPVSREVFVERLAASMEMLAHNAELRRVMGHAGQRKVVEEYDWDRKTEKILGFYEEAILGHRARKAGGPRLPVQPSAAPVVAEPANEVALTEP